MVGLACLTTLVAWVWLAVALGSRPSPAREMTFAMPGRPAQTHVLGYPPEIIQGERYWRLCDYGTAARGMCRYDAARGTADMLWPLPSADDVPWAIAAEPAGALVIATARSVLRLKPEGGVELLGKGVGSPKGISATPRVEIVTASEHGGELHALDGGTWTTTAIAPPAPPDEETTDVHLEVAIPRSAGWDLIWSTPTQVFVAPAATPPRRIGPPPVAASGIAGSFVDPTPGGVVKDWRSHPSALVGDNLVLAPVDPPNSTEVEPAYVLGKNGLEVLRRRSLAADSRTTRIGTGSYTVVASNHTIAAGPDGAPAQASASTQGMFDPWLLPFGTRWLLEDTVGQYAILDSSFARTDAVGPYERVARMFTNYDHQADLDPAEHLRKALALPIVLGGFLAPCIVLLGFAALIRRGGGVMVVISATLYLIACGVWAQSFWELTKIL